MRWAHENPEPERAQEIVEINLYGPGDAASVLEEGRIAVLGHAPIKLPPGESVTVDFGYVRSPLGALIEWGETYGTVFSVHLSDDGESFREVGRIATGDGGSDSFWWRSTTSRYFRLTVHEANSPEGAIVNELKLRILNKDRMPIGQLERAALSRARRPLPAVAPGPPSLLDRAGGVRSSRGSAVRRIRQSRAATRIRPDHSLAPARRSAARSAAMRRDQPIPGRWLAAHSERHLVCAGRRDSGQRPSLMPAKRWWSTTSRTGAARTQKGALVLAVRPVQINPYWQHGGHAAINAIAVEGRQLWVNDRRYAAFSSEPEAVAIADFDDGDVIKLIENGPQQTARSLRSGSGLLSAACEFAFSLAPGGSIAFVVSSPMRDDITPHADVAF